MAKKGSRVQVIMECTEHKTSGKPGTSRYITTKNKKEYSGTSGVEEIQSHSEENNRS
jgi:hypothetical protein